MNEEWGTPISKDKIIYRRNKLVELAKVEAKPYTIWHETINENLLDINYMIYEIERLQEELKYTIPIVEHNQTIQSNINSYNKLAKYSKELEDRIDKAINRISLIRMDRDTSIETHKALDEILNVLRGSDKE